MAIKPFLAQYELSDLVPTLPDPITSEGNAIPNIIGTLMNMYFMSKNELGEAMICAVACVLLGMRPNPEDSKSMFVDLAVPTIEDGLFTVRENLHLTFIEWESKGDALPSLCAPEDFIPIQEAYEKIYQKSKENQGSENVVLPFKKPTEMKDQES